MERAELIYLDNNATSRVPQEVADAMMPFWTKNYVNPSSIAGDILGANGPIEQARKSLSKLLGGAEESFVLTSGATEANNWVIQSTVVEVCRRKGHCRLLVSEIEHPSVSEPALAASQHSGNVDVATIPVLADGRIDVKELIKLVKQGADLVSVMAANNESGVIQPIADAAKLVKATSADCMFHTDATQAVGRMPLDLEGALEPVDFLSLSAHKFHGPKGIGALFLRNPIALSPLLHGGGQQLGRRAGTENGALAAGLGMAVEILGDAGRIGDEAARIRALRDMLEEEIYHMSYPISVLGAGAERLPNTTMLLFEDMDGEMVVHKLLEHGIIVSTGAACKAGSEKPSHVAIAMGVSYQEARNTVRVSMSRYTEESEVSRLVKVLRDMLAK